MRQPIVYVFGFPLFDDPDSDLKGYSITEDGVVIGSHISSNDYWLVHDLTERPSAIRDLQAHYPDGYVVEFVQRSQNKTHPGLLAALEKAESRKTQA